MPDPVLPGIQGVPFSIFNGKIGVPGAQEEWEVTLQAVVEGGVL